MPERVATTPGVYPLPEWAKDDLADLKGHQKHDLLDGSEGEEITSVYDEARAEVIEIQQSAGLDRIVEGQLRWDDLLAHPLTIHDNVETGSLMRYYDNNNFYREPIVEGELDFNGDLANDLKAAAELTDDLQAVIPGPYSLFDLATDKYYGDEAAFLDAIGDFLADEVDAFPDAVETLFILDPSLVTTPPSDEDGLDERAADAIDTVVDAVGADVDTVLHPYWGSLTEKVHAHVLDTDIDALGYDFVTERADNLYNINEYGTTDDVALGLIDGQNTLVESPDTIEERIDWFLEQTAPTIDFDRVYVTSNTELFYLPISTFEAKLEALQTAIDQTTEVTA
ncbi:MAG: 5-methyltetrahydropteroyltriglutamate--homocysteine methyltransferase [Halobacteriales archaeon]|nr:5-methyltetrahydropteroyltriglutamate--homocysteine methyltransferase [Halobacteriales archaeon]